MIEKGSYFKIPVENRICCLCHLNEMEGETHFMVRCTYYSEFRENLLSELSDALAFEFDSFSDNEKFKSCYFSSTFC